MIALLLRHEDAEALGSALVKFAFGSNPCAASGSASVRPTFGDEENQRFAPDRFRQPLLDSARIFAPTSCGRKVRSTPEDCHQRQNRSQRKRTAITNTPRLQ